MKRKGLRQQRGSIDIRSRFHGNEATQETIEDKEAENLCMDVFTKQTRLTEIHCLIVCDDSKLHL